MSRHFDGTGDHLDIASAIAAGQPVSTGCWFKRDSAGSDRLITIGLSGTDTHYNALALSSAGALLAISATTTATSAASSILLASTDFDWHYGLAVFAAPNDRRVYLDGANKGTSINTRAPAGQNALRAGGALTGIGEFTGYMDDLAVWLAALDDSEAAALFAGASPNSIRSGSLAEFWDLPSGGSLTGVNGNVLTATNTTTSSDTPTVISSSAPVIQVATFRAPIVNGKRRTGGVSQADTTAPSPAPILATPTGMTQTTIDLSWSASFDAQSGMRRYNIERSTTSSTDGFAAVTSVSLSFLSYKDTGLVANTRYWHKVIAEDFAGNLSTSNVVTTMTLPANTGPPGPSQTKIWSRTASYCIGGNQDYHQTAVINALAKRKFNIITQYPAWEKNKTPKAPDMVLAVKAASTIGTKMFPYIIYQSIQKVHDNPGNANWEVSQKLESAKWWAYTNGLAETGKVSDVVSTFWKCNATEAAKLSSGQVFVDWKVDWDIAFLKNGATVSNGTTSYAQVVNPNWDGLFIDNVFWRERSPNADFDRNGTAESVTLASSADAIQRGHRRAIARIRAAVPSWMVIGNSADWSEALANNPGKTFTQVCGPLDQQLDGGVIELSIGKSANAQGSGGSYEYRQNFQRHMTSVRVQMDGYRAPKWGCVEQQLPSNTDYQAMRYGLCSTLLTDAFIYHHGTTPLSGAAGTYASQDLPFYEYDEYNFDLGRRVSSVQTAPRWQGNTTTGEGIWWIEYEFGWVAVWARKGTGLLSGVTQSNYSAQPLGFTVYPLRASNYANQDPVANPGGAGISTLPANPPRDGRIYAKVAQ